MNNKVIVFMFAFSILVFSSSSYAVLCVEIGAASCPPDYSYGDNGSNSCSCIKSAEVDLKSTPREYDLARAYDAAMAWLDAWKVEYPDYANCSGVPVLTAPGKYTYYVNQCHHSNGTPANGMIYGGPYLLPCGPDQTENVNSCDEFICPVGKEVRNSLGKVTGCILEKAPQQCPQGTQLDGFDASGTIICKPVPVECDSSKCEVLLGGSCQVSLPVCLLCEIPHIMACGQTCTVDDCPLDSPPPDSPPLDSPPPDSPPSGPPLTGPPPTDSPPTDSPPTDSPPTDSPPTDSPPSDSSSTDLPSGSVGTGDTGNTGDTGDTGDTTSGEGDCLPGEDCTGGDAGPGIDFGAPPEVPEPKSWYQTKYENGLDGIWQNFSVVIAQTTFISSINKMKECIPSGGSCPSWNFNADLGMVNFGSQEIAPPCWLWDVLKGIMILSALFAARRLIFGG